MRVETTGADGKRKQSRRRFRNLKQAVDYHSGITADRSRGTHVAPADLTVQQAVEVWLDGQRIRPKTMSAYITALRPVVDHLGDRTVQSITKADIEAVVKALQAGKSPLGTWRGATKLTKGRKKIRAAWSANSVNPMLARLRSIFEDLVNQGILVRNVAALVKPIPTKRPALNTLSAEQVKQLLEATADDPFWIAWELACYGLRRGEILALDWPAVNFKTNTLGITAARLATEGGSSTGSPKTESSIRTLPMPPDLAAALRRERTRQKALRLQLGSAWPGSGMVVVDGVGSPPHPDTVTHAWRDALAGAKLPHVRLHDARHSCATLMHLNGVPAAVIAAWLGHTDARFTLSVYAHSNDDALASAATTIGGIVSGRGNTAK
ncbi:tyrosine-type recombinase/integrase [Mycolicibacter virginiensis]|uniref:tyrosine-type recombinase/integrase n=1 Tax=Mycolicibacter virginiensis TaxID=1795032 RepID=UPI003D9CA260